MSEQRDLEDSIIDAREYLESRDDINVYGVQGRMVEIHNIYEWSEILSDYAEKIKGEYKKELPNIYTVLKKIDFDAKCEGAELSILRGGDAKQAIFGIVQKFYEEILKEQL